MKAHFNLIKEDRKALVKAVAKITGQESVYQGAPSFAFTVGDCVIDRAGTIEFGGGDQEAASALLAELSKEGFAYEGNLEGFEAATGETTEEDGTGRLVINIPLSDVTDSMTGNLEKLVAAKAWILKKMAGTDELPIKRDGRHLRFPWFNPNASAAEIDAYSRLIARLCETAKEKQRIMATERQLEDGDNEKYKARCFLLSLGFIGKEYAQARKILLAPMSGSGSFKSGNSKKPDAPGAVTTAVNGTDGPEAIRARMGDSSADSADTAGDTADCEAGQPATDIASVTKPLICNKCLHHCYYTDGLMRTATGDIVDTSKRMPNKYTHYCLGTARGFRKIKNANDWNGHEIAPKWCPLNAETDSDEGESAEDGVCDAVISEEVAE